MRVRVSAMEDHQRGMITSLGGIQADIDQLNTRVARIERRLDIVEA
jgi:enoyl reductase-like protein